MTWISNLPFTYADVNSGAKPPETTPVVDNGVNPNPTTPPWSGSGNSGYGGAGTSNEEGNGTVNNGGGATLPPIVIMTDLFLREEDNDVLFTESGLPLEVEH